MDYENLCDKILKINDKIRFVGIYVEPNLYSKMKEGVNPYLTEQQTGRSLNQALYRWKARMQFSEQIGFPVFSVTKYQKVYRVTMPFEDGILGVSTEPDIELGKIIDTILEIREQAN